MEWLERMNAAIDYIEDHLTDNIDLNEAAGRAYCSVFHFQRIFSVVIGVPLGEYIRRRRLSLAAAELSSSNVKVIDVAMKYGYESPDAFTRAFRNVYEITPMAVRKSDLEIADYPRISFQIILKGGADMNFEIIEKPAFQVVTDEEGKLVFENGENFDHIPQFYREYNRSEAGHTLLNLNQGKRGPVTGGDVLGIGFEEKKTGKLIHLIGIEYDASEIPGDFKSLQIPAATWAIFDSDSRSIEQVIADIFGEWFPSTGYKIGNAPILEVYLIHGFQVWVSVIDNGN